MLSNRTSIFSITLRFVQIINTDKKGMKIPWELLLLLSIDLDTNSSVGLKMVKPAMMMLMMMRMSRCDLVKDILMNGFCFIFFVFRQDLQDFLHVYIEHFPEENAQTQSPSAKQ